MIYVDWNGEPLPQEHQSPEKFEMDAEFYPKRVAELEKQLAECQDENNKLRDALRQSCEDHRSESMYECGMYCAESESTIKVAKREALLEAAEWFDTREPELDFERAEDELRRMAKELE